MKRKSRISSNKTKAKISNGISTITLFLIFTPIIVLFFVSGLMFGSVASPKAITITKPEIESIGGNLRRNTNENFDNKSNLRGSIKSNVLVEDHITNESNNNNNSNNYSNSNSKLEESILPNEITEQKEIIEEKPSENQIFNNEQPIDSNNNNNRVFFVQEEPEKVEQFDINIPSNLELSLHATSLSYVELPFTLDSSNIIVSAWIYLDEVDHIHDMRTVFSNKKPGCDKSEDQFGFSLFVNAWQSNDMKLYAEYGGLSSGCNKIDSGDIKLVTKEWHHVVLSLSLTGGYLFVNNELVGAANDNLERHQVQHNRNLLIGIYDNGEYPFRGNISHVAIVHPLNNYDTEQLHNVISSLMNPDKIINVPGLAAYYPLKEAVNAKLDDLATDTVFSNHGKYKISKHITGHQVAGVPFKLVDGTIDREITEDLINESNNLGKLHAEEIRDTTAKLWKNYRQYAWGYDELKPLSKRGDNNWGGMSVTLVDSLDTLYLMGLNDEFNEAIDYIETSLTYNNANTISVFETTIRVLGGLLSAYDLSKKAILLNKAIELGHILLPAFDTRLGIPMSQVNVKTRRGVSSWSGDSAILSELGSLQLEFRNLGYYTNDNSYESKAMKPLHVMYAKNPPHGLFPIKVSISDGSFTDSQITFGALGDSFYEYLLKVWLQGNRRETWLREMYDKAVNGIIEVLLQTTDPNGYVFLADYNGRSINRKMDHLACFMAGVLALGAYTDPLGFDSERAQRDLSIGKALMYTCYQMYHTTVSGISAEYVEFPKNSNSDISIPSHVSFYILRPEVAESLFVLGQITKDPIYREWSWEIYQAINKHCKTDSNTFGALRNVQNPKQGLDDRMESFFIAETLKYLYLAQDPDHPIDLLNFVFNTEAHPTRIFDDSHTPYEIK